MSGYSLTMGELTAEAGVTLSTASVHLAKLESSGIVVSRKQGRSRHFRIADPDVAHCTASAQDGWMTVKVSGCDLRIAGRPAFPTPSNRREIHAKPRTLRVAMTVSKLRVIWLFEI
jgi:DNA-binding transcriptional ArsR family regulator